MGWRDCVSSYDNFTNVGAITRVPLWIFNQMDMTVPVDLVRQMVRQIKSGRLATHILSITKLK
jgi:hypothetical protein